VEASGVERFAAVGMSQVAAIAIEYAARHPERVTHLVLLGAYVRAKLKRDTVPRAAEDAETQLKLVELGWQQDDPSYRQLFASQFMLGASLDQVRAMGEVMRISASGENAARIMRGFPSSRSFY
jgi:pimeloyl-ACP methyl ester carboxylesterase